MSANDTTKMETIVSLCKRKGFIFPSSEIYGGLNSCYDYGPLGIELKRRLKDYWWHAMVQLHQNIVGLDSSILMHPDIWRASGHVTEFTDPLVDCKTCKLRFRADQLDGAQCPNEKGKNPESCGGELTDIRNFNLMFKTFMGPVESEGNEVFLRPETAQGIFVNFLNVATSARQKLPFGIAQIGKAFRNEITPGNFTFRTREFEQMEMQFFVHPSEDMEAFEMWKEKRKRWYEAMGFSESNLRFHAHGPNDLAHYAKAAFDIEYLFPIGWQEVEGIHNRTDFDLSRHQGFSKKNLTLFDEAKGEKVLPYIIETSVGADRSLLAVLCESYCEETVKDDKRVVLKIPAFLAPIQVAILPLVKKDGLSEIASDLQKTLIRHFNCQKDEGGSIGRRYRRQDEAGTPYCITIDHQTKEDGTVTIRDRDTLAQERIPMEALREKLEGSLMFPEL